MSTPLRHDHDPDWWLIECDCGGGFGWGGDLARQCLMCGGSGSVYLHAPTLRVASYPGGFIHGVRDGLQAGVTTGGDEDE